MPMYVGNIKVDVSDVSKVYVGDVLVYQKITGYTYTVDMSTTNCTPNFNFPQSLLLSSSSCTESSLWFLLFTDNLIFVPSFEEGKATIFTYAYIETTGEATVLEWDYTHNNQVTTINGQVGASLLSSAFSSSDTISYTDTPLTGSFDYDKYNLTNHEYSLSYNPNGTKQTSITASTFTSDIGISSHLSDASLALKNFSVNLAITYDGTKQTGDYILHPNNTSLTTLWQTGSGASLIRIQGQIGGNILVGKQLVFSIRAGRSVSSTHTFSVAIKSIIVY